MPTNINFVGKLDVNHGAQVNFNLPKTLSLGTVKKSFNNNGLSEAEGCSYLTLNSLNQSALLGKASLVINPSSFSENAIYADVPANSTLGDLTFTRATDAWRTSSAGLIQRTPWNLLYSSEQFVGTWSTGGATITANVTTAPNGTLTADSFFITSAASSYIYRNAAMSAPTFTCSVYVKYIDRQFIQLLYGSGITQYANFDIVNGLVTGGSYTGATITNAGSGWFRISLTTTGTTPGSVDTYIWAIDSGTALRAPGNSGSGSYYIWGAQLTEGSSALQYFPTTDRQDVPRIDYSLGGCPTLLMEPQRTNIILQSSSFNTANWTKISTVITANSAASPSGIVDATTYQGNGTTGPKFVYQQNSITSGTVYSLSVYAKKNTNNFLQISADNNTFGANVWANFDLNTGTVGSIGSSTTAKIESVGNGWYRCSITGTATITTLDISLVLCLITSSTSARYESNSLATSVFIWGAQIEAGSYPTSYIPTTTASVTRNADLASRTGVSSLIGQTEGTYFIDVTFPMTAPGFSMLISTKYAQNAVEIYRSGVTAGSANIYVEVGGSNVYFTFTAGVSTTTGRCKIAVAYKSGDSVLYINGVQQASNTNALTFNQSLDRLDINSRNGVDYIEKNNISSAALFKTRLSNSELELLTGDSFDSYAKMAAYFNYTLQ